MPQVADSDFNAAYAKAYERAVAASDPVPFADAYATAFADTFVKCGDEEYADTCAMNYVERQAQLVGVHS